MKIFFTKKLIAFSIPTLPALLVSLFLFWPHSGYALSVDSQIPNFELKTQEGKNFSSASRKGKWTVFFFYPKAGTPGCTKQACAFRDSLDVITSLKADVFGISIDQVVDQKKFHTEHKLNFTLLADQQGKVSEAFGVKMKNIEMAKRWTFIIDPQLKVRWIGEDVDPALDSQNVATQLKKLIQETPKAAKN